METEFDPNPSEPFFLIVADHLTRRFCVEGPMVDDGPWKGAIYRAREHEHRIDCGPRGLNRRSLSIQYQRETGFGGCPPGSIVRPRE